MIIFWTVQVLDVPSDRPNSGSLLDVELPVNDRLRGEETPPIRKTRIPEVD